MRKICLLLIISSFLFISGCWSRKELTDLAFVIAVGIDKTDDGKYLASFQMVNPGNVAGSSLQGGAAQGLPVAVYQTTGNSIVEAAKKGADTVSRRLYFAHTNLVVIGEKAAREGMYHILDAMERDTEFRATTTVVIAKDNTAANVLETLTPIDKIPANKIIKTVAFAQKSYGNVFENDVTHIIEEMVSAGQVPLISGFRILGDIDKGKTDQNLQSTKTAATLRAEGLGIIKNGKLAGWLTGKTARSSVIILNKLEKTAFNLEWKGKNGALVYKVIRNKTSLEGEVKNGKPIVTVSVSNEGNIGEADLPIDLTDPFIIKKLNKAAEKEIESEITAAIKKIKKKKSDVFGFGEVIRRSDPKYWRKVKSDWNDQGFQNLEVKVKVKTNIRRTELRNKPFLSDLNKL